MSTLNLSERLGPSPELARGCATLSGIAGLFRLRRSPTTIRRARWKSWPRFKTPPRTIWVFILLGISKLGEGRMGGIERRFSPMSFGGRAGLAIAGVGGMASRTPPIVEACRGKWKEALDGFSAMFASAKQDKDQRYMVLAYRERAYCDLQLGDLHAVDGCLQSIKEELDRGLTAEELQTRQDLHAIAATVALERGDHVQAADRGRRRHQSDPANQRDEQLSQYVLVDFSRRPRLRQFVAQAAPQGRSRSRPPARHGGGLPRAFKAGLVTSNRRPVGRDRPRLSGAASGVARQGQCATGGKRRRKQIDSTWTTKRGSRCVALGAATAPGERGLGASVPYCRRQD